MKDASTKQAVLCEERSIVSKTIPNVICFSCIVLIFALDWFSIRSLTDETQLSTLYWCLLWPLVIGGLSLFLSQKKRLLFLGLSVIFFTLLIAIDKLYFYFFQSLPSIFNAQAMSQIWDVHYSIYLLINPTTFLPMLFGLFVLCYPWFLRKKPSEKIVGNVAIKIKNPKKMLLANNYSVFIIFSFLLIPLVSFSPWQSSLAKVKTESVTNNDWVKVYSPITYAAAHGLTSFHSKDLSDYLVSLINPPVITDSRKQEINQLLLDKQKLNSTNSEMFAIAKDRNVVFLQMESWAEFLVDMEVDGEPVTPTSNQLKKDSLYFENIYDVTLHGRTSDAEFAVFTGLLPDYRKPAQMSHMDSYFQALPKILHQHGYTSSAIHGHDKNFWNINVAHNKYGINRSYYDDTFEGKKILGLGINDIDVFEFAAKQYAEEKQKFFSLVISLTSHHPFIDIPEDYKKLFPSINQQPGYGLLPYFLQSVRYSDDALKSFFDVAKKNPYFENTLYVIYGDHDPGVLNNKRNVNGLNLSALENDKVPVLIYIPGKEKELREFQQQMAQVSGGLHDLMPTVLHLLGIEVPYGVVGSHLFTPSEFRASVPLPQSPLYAVVKNKVIKGKQTEKNAVDFKKIFNEQRSVQEILDFSLLKSVVKPVSLVER